MAKHQFKAESRRIMDMMINSIYTHKEVFLREIISNASDACDKYLFEAIKSGESGISRDDLKITIATNKEERTITITDNGCGMSKEELTENLGTIAKSGTGEFKSVNANNEESDAEMIGQFGVGFYSAFMVSKKIDVISRSFKGEETYKWSSEGVDGFTLSQTDEHPHGTVVKLFLRDDTEDEDYSEFLDQYNIQRLIKKYSDYIRFPIEMDMTRSRPKEGGEENQWEDYTEKTVLNSQTPIWRKNKSEVTNEDYNEFYKAKFGDWEDPILSIPLHAEGTLSYDALLFIPANLPFDYYTKNFKKGLALYTNGVMITEKCEELLPDYFGFVRGVVDSEDLTLNISREVLQSDARLKLIAKKLESKIITELKKLMEKDREKYEKFFSAFGVQVKYGLYGDYGAHKEELKDLVLMYSVAEKKMLSFKEYAMKMPEGQEKIYYATAETREKATLLPQSEVILEKGYDIFAATDEVDEFALRMLEKYDEHSFCSASEKDLGLESEEDKELLKKATEDNKELLEKIEKALEGSVSAVRLSARLKKHPVCLVADGDISLDMEKALSTMPGGAGVSATRVLEINHRHPVFEKLKAITDDEEGLKRLARVLYSESLLIAGLPVADPVALCEDINGFIA